MLRTLSCLVALSFALPGAAHAQNIPHLKPIPKGTKVTLGRPTHFDEALLRLIGLQCVAETPLERHQDGTFGGTVECGAVKIESKRLAIDLRDITLDVPERGERWRIVDAAEVFPTINVTECIEWPSPAIKVAAGSDAWGEYTPVVGEVGTVIGVTAHCNMSLDVVLLQIGDHVVPISDRGIHRVP